MQTLANTLNMPIKVAKSDQVPALGAAIYAAVAAGIHSNVFEAAKAMGSDFEAEYLPQPEQVKAYAMAMDAYRELALFVENSINSDHYEFQV
jgi:L-ribulokinase